MEGEWTINWLGEGNFIEFRPIKAIATRDALHNGQELLLDVAQ
jgi:hypothetical protein